MLKENNYKLYLFLITLVIVFVWNCKKEHTTSVNDDGNYDVDKNGIPKIVKYDYIELDKIGQISKFRSSYGHSYSDNFESCRSMKHYYQPKDTVDWGGIKIVSPVKGTISKVDQEWAGTQLWIKSDEYKAFNFIIFHINTIDSFKVGQAISAGQQLGTHISSQTMSDVAVGVNTPSGWKLISYFYTLTDSIFQTYQLRGIASRDSVVISKQERDAHPLSCSGETFTSVDSLQAWVYLN